jgi:hypothetical protein
MGKSGKNLEKVCAICGKQEAKNWRRHWNTKHSGETPEEAPKKSKISVRAIMKGHNPKSTTRKKGP